ARSFAIEVDRLASTRGRGHFETRTGFTVYGADVMKVWSLRWNTSPPFTEPTDVQGVPVAAQHVRLTEKDGMSQKPSSVVVQFAGGTGTVLPVLPGFIGTVVVDNDRVVSVNYVPSD